MLTVPVAVMMCYYWWLEPWVVIIIEIVVRIGLFLRVFTKWVKWWFLFKRCFNSNFIRFWTSFDVWKRLGQLWKQIWAWGIQNWGFGMKNEILRQQAVMAREASKLTRHSEGRCDSEQRGDREGTMLPRRANPLGRRVASVPVFLFCVLCPFYTFLFWIGFWYKHGSFK